MSGDAMARAIEAVVESHLAAMHAAGICVEPSQVSARTRQLIAKQVRQPVEVAEPILRADERERVLAPIRALADQWGATGQPSIAVGRAMIRAAIGDQP